MSHWLIHTNIQVLESPVDSNEDDDDDDDDEDDLNEDDFLSESQSDCSKEYDDDDDFDNKSLEIDEEERNKISAQINPDDDSDEVEEEEDDNEKDKEEEEEEKEEIIEKEDSGQEKNQNDKEDPAFASHNSLCDDSFDDDLYQGQATATGLEEGETSMTESAESQAVDVYALIQKLDTERKQLLQELERDEQHRQWFYNQLKAITHKMESLQHTDKYTVQTDVARRQLEAEAHKVQGAMQEKLGSSEQSKLRQEARLDRIRSIESEILSLEGQAQGQAKKSSKAVRDVGTTTMLARECFKLKPDQEDGVGGYVSDKSAARAGHSASIATQTGEVTVMEISDGVAPGMPLNPNLFVMYHGAWPIEKAMSSSGGSDCPPPTSQDLASVISFNSTNTNSSSSIGGAAASGSATAGSGSGEQSQQLGPKVEMVYSLLSMLGTHDKDDMSRTLFAMSQSQDSCIAMRQSGCLPLLLQLLHGSDKDSGLLGKTRGSKSARARAAAALHNIVHCNQDDKRGRREARTLRLLEQIRAHCDQQRGESEEDEEESVVNNCSDMDHHPGAAIAALMKLSFDEDYRHAICTLGGLQAIAELLEIDNKAAAPLNDYSTTVRRYACMALTNLTFGDGKNKALLCSMRASMEALADQLRSTNEDLIQAAASVLRNLSWRADLASKKTLREIGAVTTLMKASMSVKKETTLKSILSALWNLSSHCSENKAEICAVEGALQFLVGLLTYKSAAKTLAIVENGGGILRNVSSQIAVREDYRQILRKHGCLQILLCHLRSTSLTIVSNACGTLWNLSARCEEDQNALRDMGAISMLRNLVHSRHKMISSGSSAALRNLLSSIPDGKALDNDKSVGSSRPSLHVRKQRALEAELDSSLAETCENVESPRNSPTEIIHRSESEPRRFVYHLNGGGVGVNEAGQREEGDGRKHMTRRQMMPRNGSENVGNRVMSPQRVARAGSQDSVGSTHSDISHDRTRAHNMLAKSSHLLHKRQGGSLERKDQTSSSYTMPKSGHNQHNMSEYKQHNINTSMALNNSSGAMTMVNNIPAHVRRPHPGAYHHNNAPHQQNQAWPPSMANSRIVQYMHEVAMYAGVEPSGKFHSQSLSLTQSAPSHMQPASLTQSAPPHNQPFHYPGQAFSQHQQQSLLERLAKSSSSLNSSSNLNNSLTIANTGLSSSLDFDNRHALSSSTEDETDQPVNYSLKYQDGASSGSDRNNKLSSGKTNHPTYPHPTSSSSAPNFRGTGVAGDRNFLMNNSSMHEKVPGNSSGGNIMLNPAILSPHRPVPNLVHNRFHSPQGYRSGGAPSHHQPQFMTPQGSYGSNPSFHPLGYHMSSSHPSQSINPSLPSNAAVSSAGYQPQGKLFNSGGMPAAHQNASHLHPMQQQFSAYAETDLDSVIDQPTDFSLRYREVTDENCGVDFQEQPINYSMRFRDNSGLENQDMTSFRDERHCVECKYAEARRANEQLDNSSNDDQVRTFCTEGTPYLSTATSLTDLTQAGKHDREREEEEENEGGDQSKGGNDAAGDESCAEVLDDSRALNQDNDNDADLSKNATILDADKTLTNQDADRVGGAKTDMDVTASSSGSQTTDRHTGSTVIGATCGQVALSSKASDQMSDPHSDQHNFHADSNEGSLDQTKTYCEEGTPVCFSRVSSLSSLHSSEARETDGQTRQNSNAEKTELACIEEAETPEAMVISVIENKSAPSCAKPGSNLRRPTADPQGVKSDREAKTVTFDENNQVEETPLMFSRSSSPESLSSFDTQSVHSSVISEYSRRASEVVSPSEIPDSPSESMPPSPRRSHSPTRRFRDFSSTPKATNVVSKQSLDFNKTPSTIKAEPFMSFAAFDEEDKPINFAMRNPELPLLHTFSSFDEDQPIDFSSFHREQEQRPLTFSTFQKNIQPAAASQNSHGPNNRVTPRAKTLPTLVEQTAETESSSGKSEVPVVYAEEGTPPNFSETTSLSGITMDNGMDDTGDILDNRTAPVNNAYLASMAAFPSSSAPAGDVANQKAGERPATQISQLANQNVASHNQQQQQQQQQQPHQTMGQQELRNDTQSSLASQPSSTPHKQPHFSSAQETAKTLEKISQESTQPQAPSQSLQAEEPNLPKCEEKESGSEMVLIHPASSTATAVKETSSTPSKAWSPATEQLKQEDKDSSMSEVSEGEEDILAQCISSGMPTPTSSSSRKIRRSSSDNTIKKKSGIPTKSDGSSSSKASSKPSSIPKPSSSSSLPATSAASSSSSPSTKHTGSVTSAKGHGPPTTSKPPRPSSSSSKSGKTIGKPEASHHGKSASRHASGNSSTASTPSKFTEASSTKSSASSASGGGSVQTVTGPSHNAAAAQSPRPSASKNLNPVLNKVAKMSMPQGRSSPKKGSSSSSGGGGKQNSSNSLLPQMQDLEEYADFNIDTVKSYATEGTPLNFSAATSLSDLSVLTHSSTSPSPKKSSSSSAKSPPDDNKSDNSSVCEESEELLLSQMIESGMPKNKPRKSGGGGGGGGDYGGNNDAGGGGKTNNRDCNMSAFVPRASNLTVVAPFHDFIAATDTVKTYNVEGTPKNFSAATSLSDLTIDSFDGAKGSHGASSKLQKSGRGSDGKDSKLPPTGNSGTSRQTLPQKIPRDDRKSEGSSGPGNNMSGYNVTFSPPSNDTLHLYGVEGTPITFSRNDSLSSLGGEEDGRGTGSGVSASPHKDKHRSTDKDESDSSCSIPRERHVVGQSSEDSSVAGDKGDRPIKFAVEDTPVCFSRNSSLSSLNSIDKLDQPESQAAVKSDAGAKAHTEGAKADVKSKSAEVNDGLSDDELGDCDPTPSEQALLEQCINSAMPKSRLPRGDERAKRHARAKFSIQRGGGGGFAGQANVTPVRNGLVKSASLEMTSGMAATGYYSGSETDNGSQSSLSHDPSSCENLMTRSCSDTTELDLEFQVPSSTSSRQSRYSSWRRQRHRSHTGTAAGSAADSRDTSGGGARYRSHSQDSENYLKVQKDISNKLAQAGNRSPHGRQAYQGSLDSFEDVMDQRYSQDGSQMPGTHRGSAIPGVPTSRVETDQSDRLALSDFAAKVREISNDNMGALVALKDDADIDRAVFYGHNIVELAVAGDVEGEENCEEVDEVRGERNNADEVDGCGAQNRTTGAKNNEEEEEEEGEEDDGDNEGEGVQFYIDEEGDEHDESYEVYDQVNDSFDGEISSDETARLLAENVNLVMSEILTTKMSGSTVDEDLFIENETISLVSNDYTSDTNSEVSVTWSVTSDKTSDISSATLADNRSQASSARGSVGPKIVKPGAASNQVRKAAATENDGKGIRGRRKPLYPGKSNAAGAAAKPGVRPAPAASAAGNRGAITKGPQNGIGRQNSAPGTANSGVKKTPPKNTNVAQVSPRTKQTQGNVGGQAQKGAAQRSRSAGPPQVAAKPSPVGANQNKFGPKGRTAAQGNSPAGRPGTNSNLAKTQTKSPGTVGNKNNSSNSPPSQTASGKPNANQKPKTPPTKPPGNAANKKVSNTAASASPTGNAGSQNNKENKEQTVKMREKKSSTASSSNQRHSNCSGDSSGESGNRNSSGSIPESWSKALDQFNFVVDTTQDGVPYKQIQMQRNAKDAPPAVKRALKPPNKSPAGGATPSKLPTANNKGSNTNTPVAANNRNNKSAANSVKSSNSNISNTSNSPTDRKPGQTPTKIPNGNLPNKVQNKASPNETKANAVNRSNDSLKAPNRPLTPVSSGGSRRSSNSSTSGIPTRKSDGSSPSSNIPEAKKRTPPGMVGKKQVTSKTAALWKRDGSMDRSPSRDSPLSSASSTTSSRLPVSNKSSPSMNKPSSLPPSGFKTKAATLPNSSLASSKSRSASDGISKSSTYEKISSEVHGQEGNNKSNSGPKSGKAGMSKGGRQREKNVESPETGVRRGQVFELYDSDEEDSNIISPSIKPGNAVPRGDADSDTRVNSSYDDPNESLENNVFDDSSSQLEDTRATLNSTSESVNSLDQPIDTSVQIDSNTFRKKKRDPSISDFELPNADETCRSMCSFNDSMGAPQANNSILGNFKANEDSIISEMNISEIINNEMTTSKTEKKNKNGEEKSGKTKSKVAQGLKRLFSSGRKEKDKEKESKVKNSDKELSKSKNSEKDNGKIKNSRFSKDKKGGKDKKDYDFFSTNIKIEPSTTWTVDDKLTISQGMSTVPTVKPNNLKPEHKVSPSAISIVAPFNYSPPAVSSNNTSGSNVLVVDLNSAIYSSNSNNSTNTTSSSSTTTSVNQSGTVGSNDDHVNESQEGDGSNPGIDKPMTKTEMLLARRRKTNMSTSRSEEGRTEGEMTPGCMVTTV